MTYFLIVGGISMYLARTDLLAFVDLVHAYTFASSLWILIIVHHVFKLPFAHQYLQIVDAGIFEYTTAHGNQDYEKLRKAGTLYNKIFQLIFNLALVMIFIVLSFVAPTMTNIFGGEDRKKIEELNYNLPVPCWMPFNTESPLGFTIAYTLLLVQFSLIFFVVSAAVPFLFHGAVEVSIQYKILKISITSLESRALEQYRSRCKVGECEVDMLRGDPMYERCLQECLKENILHHIKILR
ncbi:uncharacterized protein LOC120353187 [Nilaparvata lugens]|uniref:uncharacterized protein LOC120353187 n=1 Tax=Nilaparvata lugens TaxID=108931 RepID=UPI00193CA682|nr:uncharacterized protein LOC120353187 [Nilaparvata lugens]